MQGAQSLGGLQANNFPCVIHYQNHLLENIQKFFILILNLSPLTTA